MQNQITKTKQKVVILQEPSKDGFDISWRAGNMCLNRFCIDEEAGFEVSGVYRLNDISFFTVDEGWTNKQYKKEKGKDCQRLIIKLDVNSIMNIENPRRKF